MLQNLQTRKPSFLVMAFLAMISLLQEGGAYAQGRDVIISRTPQSVAEVSIAINPTNSSNLVVMGFSERTDAQMNATYSLDGGRSWTVIELGEGYPTCDDDGKQGDCYHTFRWDPTVVFDANGRLYVAYMAGGSLAVCRSLDGGQTYEGCKKVGIGWAVDKPLLATGPDPTKPQQQNLYVTWSACTTCEIFLSRSIDGGKTFSAPVTVGASGGFTQPAVGPNGEVYVSWSDNNKVKFAVSWDGGNHFSTPVEVATSTTQPASYSSSHTGGRLIPAQPERGVFIGPTLDVDRSSGPYKGRLYIAYTNVGSGGPYDIDVYVRYSTDQGNNWSSPLQVNHDGGKNSQFLPWLTVDQGTGLVSVVWYDARNDTNNKLVEVFSSFSADGGQTFDPNIKISDGKSVSDLNSRVLPTFLCSGGRVCTSSGNFLEYIGVAAKDCMAHAVWSDNSMTMELNYVSDYIEAADCPGGRLIRILLGDKDDFHPGDPIDIPPRSAKARELMAFWEADPGQDPGVNLDVGGVNRSVGLTHSFRLPDNAQITSAQAKFRLRGQEAVKNDGIFYNETIIPSSRQMPLPIIALRDLLGSEPVVGVIPELSLNLGKVPIREKDTTGGAGGSWPGSPDKIVDLLPVLQRDQRLDLIFADDVTVDYSELVITYVLPTDPKGDLTGDGVVSQNDLNIIMSVLNTDAYANDPRDIDGDHHITVLDARKLVLMCSKPRCAN